MHSLLLSLYNRLASLSRKKMVMIVLSVIVIQTVFLSAVFLSKKQAVYYDDTYSFTTANSAWGISPIISSNSELYIGEWIDGKVFKKCLSLSPDELWDYRMVNRILSTDAHPPLFFYLIHFFSSFFMDKVSLIPGLLANIFSFVLLQIFLYRLMLLLSRNRLLSLFSIACFGFTAAGINIFTFIRMYSLMTALLLGFVFYSFQILSSTENKLPAKKPLILCVLLLYLAGMTQYQSLWFAFFFSFMICLYLFLRKKIIAAFIYGLSMCNAVLLIPITFPEIWEQFGYQSATDNATLYPFRLELRIGIHMILDELYGFKTSLVRTMTFFYIGWGIVFSLILLAIVSFILRSEPWFKSFLSGLRSKILSVKKPSLPFYECLILFFTVIITLFISCDRLKMFPFFPFSDRYLFFLYPYFYILPCIVIFRLTKKISAAYPLILIILVCNSLAFGSRNYLFNEGISGCRLQDISEDSDFILVGNGLGFPALVSFDLYDSNSFIFLTKQILKENIDIISNPPDQEKPLYLLYEKASVGDVSSGEDTSDSDLDLLRNSGVFSVFQSVGENLQYYIIQLR